MNNIEFKVDIEPKDYYGKAKKLLYETDVAIEKLTQNDRDKLLAEFLQFKGWDGLLQEIRKGYNR